MIKVKVSEATGPVLDWTVAKCEGVEVYVSYGACVRRFLLTGSDKPLYAPSTDWAQGGPIIEREKIEAYWHTQLEIWAARCNGNLRYGPTLLVACMRCYVTSKLGEEVEVPEELL